jgi:uncharacterized protein YjbJ (UPF0337 family)
MPKSAKRDRAGGALYKVGSRVLEIVGSLTGDRKKQTKGRFGRFKGTGKDKEGRLKGLFKQRWSQPTGKQWGKGGCIGMQHAVTSPTYLLHGLIAKSELRELLDLLFDKLEDAPIGLLA